jgi:hypothetical protein
VRSRDAPKDKARSHRYAKIPNLQSL